MTASFGACRAVYLCELAMGRMDIAWSTNPLTPGTAIIPTAMLDHAIL